MTETVNKLEQLLFDGLEYIAQASEAELSYKVSAKKWSKKEILGHLIDSGVNNLQRFTEIQFNNKPYSIKKYNQNELVKINNYQNSDTTALAEFWKAINTRIIFIIKNQTEKTLHYKVKLEKDTITNLRFLIKDYVEHLEHHLKQIMA
ncbi:DinB family protein [Pontimicrobium sp. IMCC45349]|uniref:DinB family protein n=1 Tax=Pontimicrobium sp. IMCC45349 TaxID=3391574 RepID=UPI0039A04C42